MGGRALPDHNQWWYAEVSGQEPIPRRAGALVAGENGNNRPRWAEANPRQSDRIFMRKRTAIRAIAAGVLRFGDVEVEC